MKERELSVNEKNNREFIRSYNSKTSYEDIVDIINKKTESDFSKASIQRFANLEFSFLSDDLFKSISEAISLAFELEVTEYVNQKKPKEYDIYIYYYFSYHGKVKPALMRIAKDAGGWSEEEGEINYYEKANNVVTFKLYRLKEFMKSSNSEPQVAFFKALNPKKNQINFYTVSVKGLETDRRKIMFLTYSVVESQDTDLSCGYGILIKQESLEVAKKEIDNILKSKVDDWIVNELYNKKMTFSNFENHVYEEEKELLSKHNQYNASKSHSAYYIGYFLTKGTLVKAVLESHENGLAFLYYTSKDSKIGKLEPRYSGFMNFPTGSYVFIKGSFAYHDAHNSHRYQIILRTKKSKSTLEGVLSGWDQNLQILSTPIYFERILNYSPSTAGDLQKVIKEYDPKPYTKDDLSSEKEQVLIDLKYKFSTLFKEIISDIDECIPFPI